MKYYSVMLQQLDGLGGIYAKWNKSDRKTNTVWYHLYVESKKYSKLENKAKKESDSENKLVVTSGERGRGERQYRG